MNSQRSVRVRPKTINSIGEKINPSISLHDNTGSNTSAVDTGVSLSGLSLESLVNVRRKEIVPVFTGEGRRSSLCFGIYDENFLVYLWFFCYDSGLRQEARTI
ncbi:unnamed protein product [Ambrosiozyma monospora]|uniref:Unnamed protein product n=1 Tax=Ambrosiozyma monospora TaxID=43982 RepID=A0ACB5TX22_AMBMO|nr:unnamed protein product [Ambrosiozyma monospora]